MGRIAITSTITKAMRTGERGEPTGSLLPEAGIRFAGVPPIIEA